MLTCFVKCSISLRSLSRSASREAQGSSKILALAQRQSVYAPRCALGACSSPRQAALAHLHDHRRLHNSADELRRRDFLCLQQSLILRNLSLHHHRHVDKRVDVQILRDLGVLGHLVDRRSVCIRSEMRSWGVNSCTRRRGVRSAGKSLITLTISS